MKYVVRAVVALSFTVFFLWFAFRAVDIAEALEKLNTIEWTTLTGFLALTTFGHLCRIYRFDILVRPFAQVSWRTQMRISSVGLLLVFSLPLRLGEFARPLLLKQKSGSPLSSGLGAVAVERTIDGLMVTLLFFATTISLRPPFAVPDAVMWGAYIALGIFASAFVVLLTSLIAGARFIDFIEKLGGHVSSALAARVAAILRAFVAGLRALPNVRSVLAFVVLSLVYWGTQGLGFTFVLWGMGVDVPLVAGFVILAVVVLGIMIPAGPGNLGTFQAALTWGLAIFSLDVTTAAAFGLVVYPLTVVVIFAFGIPYLASENLGALMSTLWRAQPTETHTTQPAPPVPDGA